MSRSAGQRRGLVPPGGRVPAHRRLPDPRRPDSRTPTHPSGKPVHDCARIPANASRGPSIGQWPRPGAFSRVPSRRRATRPGLGGRSQGAIPGAIGGRYRATQGDTLRQFVQLNALAGRCQPTYRDASQVPSKPDRRGGRAALRIGCGAAGCCVARVAAAPWCGFAAGSAVRADRAARGGRDCHDGRGLPVTPSFFGMRARF